jgi:hypothetical protein
MIWLRSVLIALLLLVPVISADAQSRAPLFPTEQQAQAHCPSDVVVWVNTATGVYHYRGQRWYANTRSGAFVCRTEADRGGYRATRNGQ